MLSVCHRVVVETKATPGPSICFRPWSQTLMHVCYTSLVISGYSNSQLYGESFLVILTSSDILCHFCLFIQAAIWCVICVYSYTQLYSVIIGYSHTQLYDVQFLIHWNKCMGCKFCLFLHESYVSVPNVYFVKLSCVLSTV